MVNGQLCIDEMFAFVVLDPADNTEGIPALNSPMGPMPMVGADMQRVEQLMPIAEKMAEENGWLITVVKFSERTVLKTIDHRTTD